VRLPAAQCADWLSAGRTGCTVFFATKDGKAVSALVPAGGANAARAVEPGLTHEYHASPASDSIGTCPSRVWSLPRLRVTYAPSGARCTEAGANPNLGFIEFSTEAEPATADVSNETGPLL
jgi:hypothetical protein